MLYYTLLIIVPYCLVNAKDTNVKFLTVATENNDGFKRFIRSANIYNVEPKILGMGNDWRGGDMNGVGGGHKIKLLKEEINYLMESTKEAQDVIITFTDGYDVIYMAEPDEIIKKFKEFEDTRVLFSAEQSCWPVPSLANKYPDTKKHNPYLNSGGFIGYLPEIHKILNNELINDKDDDQLYYTKIYINDDLRDELKIKLDHDSEIFQNLNLAVSDILLHYENTTEWPYIENVVTKTRPLILHGNGPSKLELNTLGSYLAKAWSPIHGCKHCEESYVELKEELPEVMLALFVEQPTPFLEEFFKTIGDIDYPKKKIHLFLRNNVEYHEYLCNSFIQDHSKEYATVKRIKPNDYIIESQARNIALERCLNTACEYLFVVDSVARVKPHTLQSLLKTGKDVVAPLLARPQQMWSNFWGALNQRGFYARSLDYMEIVNYENKGIWNVPFITNCYLIKKSSLQELPSGAITYEIEDTDADMAFCASLRKQGKFFYVNNLEYFGHLVNPDKYDITLTNPDVYELFENQLEWEKRYIHEDYYKNFEDGRKHLQPCPDVYWFPLTTKRFCKEWIEIMEAYGKWSDGSNNDERLKGGYEAVPTRDIHMNQVGLEKQWLQILKDYVRPLQEMVFLGYYNNPPNSIMNFVVRYRPDEQPSLRPHHDSSTYTINLALNRPKVDYEGGGCRFLRYNCSVLDTKPGWLLMHPGRLTHFHEGLPVTNGTRYIMISFVDP